MDTITLEVDDSESNVAVSCIDNSVRIFDFGTSQCRF